MSFLRAPLALALAAMVTAAVAATQPTDVPERSKDGRAEAVLVRGCLTGTYLSEVDRNVLPDRTGTLASAGARLKLVGSRAMMRQLREHQHHLVEVEGLVTEPPNRTARVRQFGRAKVYAARSK